MITEDILNWVATLPIWQKKLGYLIIEDKNVTDEEIEEIYDTFKKEMSLEEGEIVDTYTHICVHEPAILPTVKWLGVGNLHGVNRLKSEAELSVSEGLTVIYGENGSGKSGYTRLLNNAFVSRGDQEILPNVFSDSPEDVSAEFKFCIDGNQVEYKYPENKDEFPFETIRNFDSKSASKDMNKETMIDFAPSELSFFDLFLFACMKIQKKLDDESAAKKIENPTLKYFSNDGEVLNQMKALSANSEIDKIKENFAITEQEKVFFEQIKTEKAKLIALDINRQIELIDQVIEVLNSAIKKYQQFKRTVSSDNIEIYNQQIEFLKKCKSIHDTDGMMLFEKENIELIGTPEWKEFINSAKKYYDAITNHIQCPLCGHEIEEKDLILKYWKYLESDAENNLKVAKEAIRVSKEGLRNLDLSFFVESSVQEQWILENFKKEAEIISQDFMSADIIRKQILQNLENECVISTCIIPTADIQNLITKIVKKKESLNQESINQRLRECEKIENEYNDKTKIVDILPLIENYIDYLKWAATAEKSKIKTRGITNKQKELFEKYVTDDYLETFKNECEKLDAKFNVEIIQKGSSGQTVKKLQIKGLAPGKILSEGEQRAISIASFLTEANMDARNIGIVLDDPVSSLDHRRRSCIAKRLIEEASRRQVVVFTHEITFFMELKTEADNKNIAFKQETIRNLSNEPGDISSVIPWQGMTVRERTGKLKNDLQYVSKLFKDNEMDEYYYKAKEWCELLRESWERAVEEILFNDAIQRYNPSVQTQRLKQAPFTKESYRELEKGMNNCSNWCHDQARGINGSTPSADDLKKYIGQFEEYCKKYRVK